MDGGKGNVNGGQNGDHVMKEDSRYFSCHLHLSEGDDSSIVGDGSPEKVPQFHLHLSSEGISQFSFGALSCIEKIGPFRPNREVGPALKATSLHHEVDCSAKDGKGSTNVSVKEQSQYIKKKKKVNVDRYCNASDIDDAIELTVAASEALVISEVTKTDSDSKLFSTAALLEVALRVKQVRAGFHEDTLKVVSSSLTDERDDDEMDQLDDLDDYIMADAFADVGLLNIINTVGCDHSSDGVAFTIIQQKNVFNLRHSEFPHVGDVFSNTHLPEDHQHLVPQKTESRTKDPDISVVDLRTKPNHSFTAGSKLTELSLQAQLPRHKEPYAQCNLNILDASNMKDQDGENILHRDKKLRRRIPNLFQGETSFISESMDISTDGNALGPTPEADPKIVSSSNSLSEDGRWIPCDVNRENMAEVVASCESLEMDTLCSVVPCSLADDDNETDHLNQASIGRENICCLKPATELIGMQNAEEPAPTAVADEREYLITPSSEGPMVAHKLLNSLWNYSTLVPSRRTFSLSRSFFLKDPNPTESVNLNLHHMTSGKEIAERLMEPTARSRGVNEQRHNLESHNKTCRPTAIPGSNFACTGQSLQYKDMQNSEVDYDYQHADMSVPIILNARFRRRIQPCGTSLPPQDKASSTKVRNMEKNGKEMFLDECSCRGEYCACKASSHTHFIEEYHPPTKKVRFDASLTDIHHLHASLSEEQSLKTRKQGSSNAKAIYGFHVTNTNKGVDFRKSYNLRTRKSKSKSLSKHKHKDEKKHIFDGQQFLLTGISKKMKEEVETLIRRHGGLVLPNRSSLWLTLKSTKQNLPIVLSSKKVQTTIFLCGCAIKTWLLQDKWLSDSVQAGFMLSPTKYLILPNQASDRKHMKIGELHACNSDYIFDKLGVMLFGKKSFCAKFSKVIESGGGQVFKTLHQLVKNLKNGRNNIGAIVFEEENYISRHLKHCALEHDLHTMPASWITNSLFSGKLLPCKKDRTAAFHRIKRPRFPLSDPLTET